MSVMLRTAAVQLNVCTAPHTGPAGSPLVGSASTSTTHAWLQYKVSASSPVKTTGVSVPLPVVLEMLSLAVVIWLELYVEHGA